MGFGNSLTTGYRVLLQTHAAQWLLTQPEAKVLIEKTLRETGPTVFGGRLVSLGVEASGRAFLNFTAVPGLCTEDPDSKLDAALNALMKKDSFLAAQNFNLFYSKDVVRLFGHAVQASNWWVKNKKELSKAFRDLKKVRQVHES